MKDPDSESEEEVIEQIIEHRQQLFEKTEELNKKDGIYYIDGDLSRPHPL